MTTETQNRKAFLSRLALKGLLRIAGKQDVRCYINGVCIDFDKHMMVATDGHRILVVKLPDDVECEGTGEAVIPRESIELALKAHKKEKLIEFNVTQDGAFTLGDISGRLIDSRYPDWTRVIPQNPTGEVAQYNANYIADFQKAFEDMYDKVHVLARITHNGASAGLVTCGELPDVLGVCMPYRDATRLEDVAALVKAFFAVSEAPFKVAA